MKKAFTLIEIMIALMILSILLLAMNGVIKGLKSSKSVLDNYYLSEKKNELFVKVLYEDILNSSSLKIVHSKNSDYDRIYLTTSNSLYHLINPYVLWYVSRNKNTLIRVESPFKINLPNYKLFFMDKFKNEVTLFRVYNKPVYFEMTDKNLGVKNSAQKTDENSTKNNNSDAENRNNNSGNTFLPTF